MLGVGQRGDAPTRRLEPEQPAHRPGDADGGTAVGAQGRGGQPRGHGGRAPSAGAARGPLDVPRVARRAVPFRLGHVPPHRELGQRRLAQHGRAAGAQAAHHLGVARRRRLVGGRAVAGHLPLDVHVVLDGDRDAEQRAGLARPQALQRSVGLGQRGLGAHGDERVQLWVQALDAPQVALDQVARGDRAGAQQLALAGDAGEGEVRAGRGGPIGVGVGRGAHRGHRAPYPGQRALASASGGLLGRSWHGQE